jgi:putrescine transport system ATP-binding protein
MSQALPALDNYTTEFGLVSGAGYLRTEKLLKRYDGIAVVDEVNLSIRKGEIFALLGSSGCGKSTLLRMLAGFEKPSAGSIVLGGNDIGALAPHERPINMMFQSYALFPHLNVWDNIAFGLKREGMDKASIAVRVDEMLTLTQLESFAKRKPEQLSGGQQQRVALARSLAKKPQLLLLDEPLGALDKKLRERTQFELVNILQSVGVTCVMVTHDQDEAMAMASRIAVMSQGRVLQVGTPREIYEHPNCRFVADFIGNVNVFEGQLSRDEPDCCDVTTRLGVIHIAHGVSGPLGMSAAVALRPEKIHLSKYRPNVGVNLFTGKVREIAYFGSYSSYLLETAAVDANANANANIQTLATTAVQTLPDTISIRISQSNTARQDGSPIDKGDRVYFWWDATAPVVLTL